MWEQALYLAFSYKINNFCQKAYHKIFKTYSPQNTTILVVHLTCPVLVLLEFTGIYKNIGSALSKQVLNISRLFLQVVTFLPCPFYSLFLCSSQFCGFMAWYFGNWTWIERTQALWSLVKHEYGYYYSRRKHIKHGIKFIKYWYKFFNSKRENLVAFLILCIATSILIHFVRFVYWNWRFTSLSSTINPGSTLSCYLSRCARW